ncbi:MAG: hypothetical protein ACKOA8_10365, partial [Deltaproteobacteria bacterium]
MRFVTVPLLLIVLSFQSVFASPQFNRCKAVLRSLSQPTQDSSVELEISNSDPILELLTTTDGTLAPLLPPKHPTLPNGYALLPELERSFKDWSYEEIAQERWDHLTPEQKRHFLKWITLRKTTDFFKDQKMPGIKIKDKAYLTFTKPTEFLGKTYEPGTH